MAHGSRYYRAHKRLKASALSSALTIP